MLASTGGWSASDSVRSNDDHHLGSVAEVSAGSGRSKDPSGVSAGNNPSPHASPTSLQISGGYSLANKDQCRSVASGVDVPVALVVDEVVPLQSYHDRKVGADP